MRLFTIIAIFLGFTYTISAQFYSTGNESASVKWSQIESEHFVVVYPQEFDAKGKMISAYLEEVYKSGGQSLKHNPQKITVIVHAQSVVANGMVAWAPKRMELYPVNPQDTYAQSWFQQLSIHEFRHVVQMDMMNSGFTKFLSYLFGQQAVGAVVGLYIPTWFLEGDAVYAETLLTESGRGRMPSFSQGLKAQLLDKEAYSYEKATLGSYKDYVPNRYELGYQLVTKGREFYGDTLWTHTLNKSAVHSYSFNPFLRGIRDISGYNKREFYKQVMDSLIASWSMDVARVGVVTDSLLVSDSLDYKDYLYPQLHQNSVVALVKSPSFISKFVIIDSVGLESTLIEVASRNDEPFHLQSGKLVWSEFRNSIRYEHKNYSVIKVYDLTTRACKTLTHKSRYFAPQFHPFEDKILAVEFNENGTQSLVILNSIDGSFIKRYEVGFDEQIISPVWSSNGKSIASILLDNRGKRIAELNIESEKWSSMSEPSYTDISNLSDADSCYIFTSLVSGEDNLFLIDKRTKQIERLTRAKYGNNYGRKTLGGDLIYSAYTANGYRPSLIKNIESESVIESIGYTSQSITELANSELLKPQFSLLDSSSSSKSYSRLNLLNVHSWGPYIMDNNEVFPGISLMSQNILSNTVMSLGYNSDPDYRSEKYQFNIRYSGFFPELECSVKYGDRQLNYSYYESMDVNNNTVVGSSVYDKQSLFQVNPKVSIPLNLSRGNYSNSIVPSAGLNYQTYGEYSVQESVYLKQGNGSYLVNSTTLNTIPESNYISAKYGIYLSTFKHRSERDVWSKAGVALNYYYQHSPWGNYSRGTMSSVKLDLYYRGFFKHDGFKVSLIYEDKNPDISNNSRHDYSNLFPYSRGYDNLTTDKIFTSKTDYQVTLLNPDAVLSGAVYLKRVRMNLFADYSKYCRCNSSTQVSTIYEVSSVGADFWADVHFFQWGVPFSIGYRIGYKPTGDQNFYEVLWSIQL